MPRSVSRISGGSFCRPESLGQRFGADLQPFDEQHGALDFLQQLAGGGVINLWEVNGTFYWNGWDNGSWQSDPAVGEGGAPITAKVTPAPTSQPLARAEQRDAPYCYQCGNAMQRAGSCYVCSSCGTTSGCS